MKLTKILTTAIVALGATLALSGCIRETYPMTSTITQEQLMGGQMDVVATNLLKGIPRGMLAPCYGGWEHTDFGFPSVGVYNDQAAQLVVTNGWTMGNATGFNRFMMGAWGKGYGATGWMPVHFWYTYYPQIKSCNDVITLTEGNEDLASYSAIARTYRANFYLDLARLFECMYVDNADYATKQLEVAGLTVPIVNEFTDEKAAKSNPRATREEMFTFILSDLAFAEEAFKSPDYTPIANTDPTLAVVYGLYARVYLWLGGFEDGLNGSLPEGNDAYALAAEYARKAIDEFGGAIMSEAEWTNVTTGFNTKASSWMWTLFHSTDTVPGNLHQFPAHMAPEAAYGYCQFTNPGVGSKAYERLGDGDFRKKLMISPDHFTVVYNEELDQDVYVADAAKAAEDYAAFAPYTQITLEEYMVTAPYSFFKFRPAQGNRTDYMTAGAIAVPVMRCEEMYFIEMEAIAHTQGPDAAAMMLGSFMNNRDSSYAIKTQDIVDEIIFQKGIEFWGEGQIMYDMKRLNKGVQCAYPGTNYDPQRRFNTDGRLPFWTPQIPLSETQVNLGIKAEDNNPDPTDVISYVKM